MLNDRNIVLGVTGGIAVYKAAELCSVLRRRGAAVRVAMTESATKFVAPLTFETLTQQPVYTSIFDASRSWEMEHISWSKWGEVLVVAPATANIIGKMATGFANDPVSTIYLSFPGPVIVAPAMNTNMLNHPATAENLATLRRRGVTVIDPEEGRLACGDIGAGRLASLDRIVDALETMFAATAPAETGLQSVAPHPAPEGEGVAETPADSATSLPQDRDETLAGKTVLITSGPTHEYLDPVRFLTNPSSGRMGSALAREAARRGASVHFVSGPVNPSTIPVECAKVHKVVTAEHMLRVVRSLAETADIFVFAAAVSDFRVANPPGQKIKRTGNSFVLQLIENPDIAQAVGCIKRPDQVTVGFAAETHDLEINAVGKMERKHLDAIVANDVANPRIGFDKTENEATMYLRNGSSCFISKRPKPAVAREIFEIITQIVKDRAQADS